MTYPDPGLSFLSALYFRECVIRGIKFITEKHTVKYGGQEMIFGKNKYKSTIILLFLTACLLFTASTVMAEVSLPHHVERVTKTRCKKQDGDFVCTSVRHVGERRERKYLIVTRISHLYNKREAVEIATIIAKDRFCASSMNSVSYIRFIDSTESNEYYPVCLNRINDGSAKGFVVNLGICSNCRM